MIGTESIGVGPVGGSSTGISREFITQEESPLHIVIV